jgi:hypothetical protein
MDAYVGISRWFPVSLQTDDGTQLTGLPYTSVVVSYQIGSGSVTTLTLTGANDWQEVGDGIYRFNFNPDAQGLLIYYVDTSAVYKSANPSVTAIVYEGSADVLTGPAAAADSDPQAAQNTLAGIRQIAMDRTDEQHNPLGNERFSVNWWNRQINYVYRFLAEHTGFYVKRTTLTEIVSNYALKLPDDFCWGILRVTYDGIPLEAVDIFDTDEDSPGWETGTSGIPSGYMVAWPNLEFNPIPSRIVAGDGFTNQATTLNAAVKVYAGAADLTQSITVWGTTTGTTTVVSETVKFVGSAVPTIKTNWGYILGATLDKPCAAGAVITNTSDAEIARIPPNQTTIGVRALPWSGTSVYPTIFCSGTSTARIALIGSNGSTAVTSNCVALSGTADVAGKVTFPNAMTGITYVLVGALPTTQYIAVNMESAVVVMHAAVPAALVSDSDVPKLPGGFTYLLADGAAMLALTGDLRYNESTNSQSAPMIQQFWQGVGQLEELMDTMQRDRVQLMGVVSPHSPYT